MGWKEWSYWLKGGIIGISIFIISVFLAFTIEYLFPPTIKGWSGIPAILFIIFFLTASFPAYSSSIFVTGLDVFNTPNILGWIFSFVTWFLIGSFIGWIVGKIRRKQ